MIQNVQYFINKFKLVLQDLDLRLYVCGECVYMLQCVGMCAGLYGAGCLQGERQLLLLVGLVRLTAVWSPTAAASEWQYTDAALYT